MLMRDVRENLYQLHLEDARRVFGEREFINLSEAARYLGFDPRTLQAMRSFPRIKYGRTYRVSIVSMCHWISNKEI